MKSSQVASLVMALGFALPVAAQNSVVRSSDFLDQDAVTVTSKVAAAYQKPVVAVAQIPTVAPVEASESVEVYSMSNNDITQPSLRTVVEDSDKPSPPAVVTDGPYRFYPETGAVDFNLRKGLLKPQLVELLMHHRLIDSTDDIQWQASDNFMWPNSHTLSGASLDHVINAVLAPYKLVADFKGNGSVIVKKL
ncbi:hypothetical protein PSH47_15790 [Pseudoalteromonas sp. CST5]|uniref:hypothetical protein n=1 Tax=unclassified Pseudoalteromonas TaxID=194690 RepID=UPI002358F8AE|nr:MULTISPECIES: hypothetical protein [unclassified Pseudoalteromonas]MDC9514456.1 hypothetical protein [Pseudoalteromonas sp. CST1]MDC9538902.1 hypothetical protein [Pseudoalteromonas sp. CST3]MDC9543071.1 hypothetical protein [Pseudoalteromonas sp. CST2]MDC9545889.1 hypothetical protein [Pseudoalteromonas sp. CST4]MDC9550595.1 hypothetical protein [Pseudoalteromonas sp. CST5]